MSEQIMFKGESYEIVGAAIEVWKKLGYGFLEKVYENSMAIELEKRAIPFEQQKPIKVFYEGRIVGDYIADIIVGGKILLELKSAQAINDAFLAQTLNYLKATGIRLGIILNFGPDKMESKRVVF
ncbi:MAG TPA: GxxExxY protein [Terriglobia bacterium]|nr:GxxExxY protein [Terriglobia bacterium]